MGDQLVAKALSGSSNMFGASSSNMERSLGSGFLAFFFTFFFSSFSAQARGGREGGTEVREHSIPATSHIY